MTRICIRWMKTFKGGMKILKGWDEIFKGWDENFKGGGMKTLVPPVFAGIIFSILFLNKENCFTLKIKIVIIWKIIIENNK